MRRPVYILFLVLAFSCTKEGDTYIIVQEDPTTSGNGGGSGGGTSNLIDNDGDGVENDQELLDNTDPNDPCSYDNTSQIYFNTSVEWRGLDCDGDGVTNGLEMDPDGDGVAGPVQTNPKDMCDYDPSLQELSTTTGQWWNRDCDGDGVTNLNEVDPDGNNQNDGNGTDPFDWCDLDYTMQTVSPWSQWLDEDCDNDCYTNGEEIASNTDPTDPNDNIGIGSGQLVSVNSLDDDNDPIPLILYDENTGYYTTSVTGSGTLLASLEYNQNGRLTEAKIRNGSSFTIYTYTYSGDEIATVTRTSNGNTQVKNVTYNGNVITTFDGNEPPGLFTDRITLDPVNSKAIGLERYTPYTTGQNYSYSSVTYTYDSTQENIMAHETEIQGYNPASGTYFSVMYPFINKYYEYDAGDVINPSKPALDSIYIHYLISGGLLNHHWIFGDAAFSSKQCTRLDVFDDYAGGTWFWSPRCSLDNNPIKMAIATDSFGFEASFTYQ